MADFITDIMTGKPRDLAKLHKLFKDEFELARAKYEAEHNASESPALTRAEVEEVHRKSREEQEAQAAAQATAAPVAMPWSAVLAREINPGLTLWVEDCRRYGMQPTPTGDGGVLFIRYGSNEVLVHPVPAHFSHLPAGLLDFLLMVRMATAAEG